MSNTMTATSPIEELESRLQGTARLFTKDLSCMTHEMLAKPVAGKARSGYDVAFEVARVNKLIADQAKGKEVQIEPGWPKAPESFSQKDTAIREVQGSVDDLLAALKSVPQDRLSQNIQTPMGSMPLIEVAQLMPVHIMYHSGQLNFIQTCYGDDQFHWAD